MSGVRCSSLSVIEEDTCINKSVSEFLPYHMHAVVSSKKSYLKLSQNNWNLKINYWIYPRVHCQLLDNTQVTIKSIYQMALATQAC